MGLRFQPPPPKPRRPKLGYPPDILIACGGFDVAGKPFDRDGTLFGGLLCQCVVGFVAVVICVGMNEITGGRASAQPLFLRIYILAIEVIHGHAFTSTLVEYFTAVTWKTLINNLSQELVSARML